MASPLQQYRSRLLLLSLAGGLLAGLLAFYQLVAPLDRLVYDLFSRASPLAGADDIVIIAVDEPSLEELGRWPWPRAMHVQLIRKLEALDVKAVALDLLITEPERDYPEVDKLLADAIASAGNVLLPVFFAHTAESSPLRAVKPLPPLAGAAAGLGHAHVEMDSDGLARRVYLQSGVGGNHWPHLGLALARFLAVDPQPVPGHSDSGVLQNPSPHAVIRSHANLLPLMGPAGTVPSIAYADVLLGKVNRQQLAGKIVFVGVTAAGLVDQIPTFSGQISGVELDANIFHAIRSGALVQALPPGASALLAFVFCAMIIPGFRHLQPAWLLLATASLLLLLPLASYVSLQLLGLWLSPVPVIISLLLTYPTWNWLRLASALGVIRQHLEQLEQEQLRYAFSDLPPHSPIQEERDPLSSILLRLDTAYAMARTEHELIREALERLTTGVIVTNTSYRILLVNDEARSVLGLPPQANCIDDLLPTLGLGVERHPEQLYRLFDDSQAGQSREYRAANTGRDILIRGGAIGSEQQLLMLVITDVSAMKNAERRRFDALNFLSHDLRAPLTSILALIDSSRDAGGQQVDITVLEQIEGYIRSNLSYAENYIQLARLEHGNRVHFSDCEASSLMDNAVGQLYHSARKHGVQLNLEYYDEDIWLHCSRELVERLLLNLIDNAISHSKPGERVTIASALDGDIASFSVADSGPGLAPEDLERIFEAFEQGHNARGGVGLGLRFCAAAAAHHGGEISADNNSDAGATFTFSLPAQQA